MSLQEQINNNKLSQKPNISGVHFGDVNTVNSYLQFSNWILSKIKTRFNTAFLSEVINSGEFGAYINSDDLQKEFDEWRESENLFKYNAGEKTQLLNLRVRDLLIPALTYFKCLTFKYDKRFDDYKIEINNNFIHTKTDFAKALATKLSPEDKTQVNKILKSINPENKGNLNALVDRTDDIAECYEQLWTYLIGLSDHFSKLSPDQQARFRNITHPSAIFCIFDKKLNPSKYVNKSNFSYSKFSESKNVNTDLVFEDKDLNLKPEFYNWSHLLFSLALVNGVDEQCKNFELQNIDPKNKSISINASEKQYSINEGYGILSNEVISKVTDYLADDNNLILSTSGKGYLVKDMNMLNSRIALRDYANTSPSSWLEYLTAIAINKTFNVSWQKQFEASSNKRYFKDKLTNKKYVATSWIQADDNVFVRNGQLLDESGYFSKITDANQTDSSIIITDKNGEIWQINFEPTSNLNIESILEKEHNCILHFYGDYWKHRNGKENFQKYEAYASTVSDTSDKRQPDSPVKLKNIKHNLIIQVSLLQDQKALEEAFVSKVIAPEWKNPLKQISYAAVNIKDLPSLLEKIKSRDMSWVKPIQTNIADAFEAYKMRKEKGTLSQYNYTQEQIDHFETLIDPMYKSPQSHKKYYHRHRYHK